MHVHKLPGPVLLSYHNDFSFQRRDADERAVNVKVVHPQMFCRPISSALFTLLGKLSSLDVI